ncbi:hypothetical protein LWI28_011845 [Acer negundo]|uniref:Auxin-responsive protein n=1 Tax=Acer negundo TaxID=4023 RepID=A0AAD5J999_ACENE|nr:hypothetical protein LWI28_011845 [Acer negundo]
MCLTLLLRRPSSQPPPMTLMRYEEKIWYKIGQCGPNVMKAQVVGWPPVRSSRKKSLEMSKLVKVHGCRWSTVSAQTAKWICTCTLGTSYQQLFRALEQIFTCFTIHAKDLSSLYHSELILNSSSKKRKEKKKTDFSFRVSLKIL